MNARAASVVILAGLVSLSLGWTVIGSLLLGAPRRMNTFIAVELQPGTNIIRTTVPRDSYICTLWEADARAELPWVIHGRRLPPEWIQRIRISGPQQTGTYVYTNQASIEVLGFPPQPLEVVIVTTTNGVAMFRANGK